MARLPANFILFQIAWFAAVLAPFGLAAAAAALILTLHVALIAQPREWRFIALAAAIGALIDTALALGGIFTFNEAHSLWPQPFIPLWLLLIWANFAATLCHSLRWLGKHRRLAFIAGSLAGPLAYIGGTAISDKLMITAPLPLFIAISAPCWGLLCIMLPYLAQRMTARHQ